MHTRDRYAIPAKIACMAALILIALILVGAW
jgi:hypothetical protein